MNLAILAGTEFGARVTHYSAASHLMSKIAMVVIVLGAICSCFPLWKSATLSPDSIERRTYWTASAIAAALLFLAELPHWKLGLFVSIGVGLGMFSIALSWTNHIKIAGRVIAMPSRMGPDRPPALSKESCEE